MFTGNASNLKLDLIDKYDKIDFDFTFSEELQNFNDELKITNSNSLT